MERCRNEAGQHFFAPTPENGCINFAEIAGVYLFFSPTCTTVGRPPPRSGRIFRGMAHIDAAGKPAAD